MHWLMVEDALRGDAGHWRDYVRVFRDGLVAAGDTCTVLCARGADAGVVREFEARPVLPDFAWETRRRGLLTRLTEGARHVAETGRAVLDACRERRPDVIYVPTVKPVHIATWGLMMDRVVPEGTRVVLLFMNGQAVVTERGAEPTVPDTRATRMVRTLLARLERPVREGRLLLVSDTPALAREYAEWSGLPFTYVPQPVAVPVRERAERVGGPVVFGAFGDGRHEKGTDVLQEAMRRSVRGGAGHRFLVQWVTPFPDPAGVTHAPDAALEAGGVEFVRKLVGPDEYEVLLARTDVLVLPYRRTSYARRGSRVVIEAVVNGIPVVATRGTSLADVAREHGAGVEFVEDDADSLAAAMDEAARRLPELRARATERMPGARAHFSVAEFQRRVLAGDSRASGSGMS
jgi:glycosyltransferase involved in cell wall biosynthesis